jgi:hypothetical protein
MCRREFGRIAETTPGVVEFVAARASENLTDATENNKAAATDSI